MILVPTVRGDDSPLALTDLADYRRALIAEGSAKASRPPLVSFRALWDHSTDYQGKRVQVEGRIVRRFRQGAVGTFPPLVEAWAVTPAGDPFCWVYPSTTSEAPTVREHARFVGTYLKRIRYQGADVDRLAPLIVGPGPPVPPPKAALVKPSADHSIADWILGGTCAAAVLAVLAWQHLKKPAVRTAAFQEPDPSSLFLTPAPPRSEDRTETRDDGRDERPDSQI